jgi:hypothetical protein
MIVLGKKSNNRVNPTAAALPAERAPQGCNAEVSFLAVAPVSTWAMLTPQLIHAWLLNHTWPLTDPGSPPKLGRVPVALLLYLLVRQALSRPSSAVESVL